MILSLARLPIPPRRLDDQQFPHGISPVWFIVPPSVPQNTNPSILILFYQSKLLLKTYLDPISQSPTRNTTQVFLPGQPEGITVAAGRTWLYWSWRWSPHYSDRTRWLRRLVVSKPRWNRWSDWIPG